MPNKEKPNNHPDTGKDVQKSIKPDKLNDNKLPDYKLTPPPPPPPKQDNTTKSD